jgi:hypothetical protein
VISVPNWLGRDWRTAFRFGGAALVTGVAIQYAILLLLVLAHAVAGFDITWDNQLDRVPVHVFLSLHGPLGGVGLWATGIAWISIAFYAGGRLARPERSMPDDAPRWRRLALPLKTAVVYMVPVAVLIAVLEPTDYLDWLFPMGFIGEAIGNTDWNLAAGIALGLFVSFIAASWVMAHRSAISLSGLYGVTEKEAPAWLGAAWAGAKRTLLIGVPLVLAFFVIGELIDILGDDLEFRVWLGLVLAVAAGTVLWIGIDVGVVFLIMTMRFFLGDDTVVAGGRPGWMWAAVAIVVVAFVFGGMRAAARYEASSAPGALAVGMLAGAFVGVALFVLSWFALNPFPDEVITGPALGLPILWSVASGIGGLIYARRRGLFGAIRLVQRGE